MRRERLTTKDLVQAAGVSWGPASNAMANKATVPVDLRDRVMRTMVNASGFRQVDGLRIVPAADPAGAHGPTILTVVPERIRQTEPLPGVAMPVCPARETSRRWRSTMRSG